MPISTDIGPLMERGRALRLRQDHVSRYSGVNTTVLSRAQNYGQYVEGADFRKIEAFIDAAEELTRRAGAALDWRDFTAIDRLLKEYEVEKCCPPGLPTSEDWELLHSLSAANGFVDTAATLGITMPQLFDRVDAMNKRFDYQINRLSRGTAMRRAHVDLMNKELENRKDSK